MKSTYQCVSRTTDESYSGNSYVTVLHMHTCDFYMFPGLKISSKEYSLESLEDIHSNVTRVLE